MMSPVDRNLRLFSCAVLLMVALIEASWAAKVPQQRISRRALVRGATAGLVQATYLASAPRQTHGQSAEANRWLELAFDWVKRSELPTFCSSLTDPRYGPLEIDVRLGHNFLRRYIYPEWLAWSARIIHRDGGLKHVDFKQEIRRSVGEARQQLYRHAPGQLLKNVAEFVNGVPPEAGILPADYHLSVRVFANEGVLRQYMRQAAADVIEGYPLKLHRRCRLMGNLDQCLRRRVAPRVRRGTGLVYRRRVAPLVAWAADYLSQQTESVLASFEPYALDRVKFGIIGNEPMPAASSIVVHPLREGQYALKLQLDPVLEAYETAFASGGNWSQALSQLVGQPRPAGEPLKLGFVELLAP